MSDWDIDSPVKGDSSGPQPPSSVRAAGAGAPAPDGSAAGRSASGSRGATLAPGTGEPAPALGGAAPRRRRVSLPYLWVGILVVVLVAGLMAGFFIGRSQYSGDAAALADADGRLGELQKALSGSEDRNWTYYRTVEGLKEQLAQATSSTSATAPLPGGVRTSYSDGVYLVGEDIPPGTYDGVVNGSIGYWARLKTTDGSISSIIENGIPRGPFVLTIATADAALELRGVTLTPH